MEQPSPEIIAALRRSGLCEGLGDKEVERLAREGVVATYRRGEVIFNEDSDANRLYLILRGVVRIETRPPHADGAGLVLDHLQPGRVLGEVGFVDGRPRSAAAVCEEDAALLTLTRADVDRLSRSEPLTVSYLYRNIARELGQKLRDSNAEMREVMAFTGGPDPDLAELAARAGQAQRLFVGYTQDQVDRLVQETAGAIYAARDELASITTDETGMGCYQDKVARIEFAIAAVRDAWATEKTAGVLREVDGTTEILEPVGPLCLVVSEANPTAAIVFHTLLALKTRNAAVIAIPPRATQSGVDTARLVYDAALRAGAPEHWLGWIATRTDHRRTLELVRRPEIRIAVVSGRPSLARALGTCGKPLLADGSGCTPCYVHHDADPASAAADIVQSKTFDHGSCPAGEQVLLVHEDVLSELMGELALRGASFVGDEAREPLTTLLFPTVPRDDAEAMVGRAAADIARLANIQVPPGTSLIAIRLDDVSTAEPLAGQKFSPVVAFVQVSNEEEGLRLAHKVLEHGGMGHTAVIHTRDQALAERFARELPVLRTLVNCPATQGSVGGTITAVPASLTMGAGTAAFSQLSDNLAPRHLLQIRRVVRRRSQVATAKPAGSQTSSATAGRKGGRKASASQT